MPRDARGHFVKDEEKAELLTTEHHPILGTLERWRMADGTVKSFYIKVTTEAVPA